MKHLSIVAEYVETEEQRDALRALGVDYMQGYLIGKPEPLINLIS
jgi:EAL domain-containing protein (putative c-di-GMP-specific phosphodiesterase class I)